LEYETPILTHTTVNVQPEDVLMALSRALLRLQRNQRLAFTAKSRENFGAVTAQMEHPKTQDQKPGTGDPLHT